VSNVTDQPTAIRAIAAAMQDLRAVEKTSRNETQGYVYRGADAVINAAAPVLRRHGIVTVPTVETAEYVLVEYGTKLTRMTSARVLVSFRLYGPAGDHVIATVSAEGADTGDKAMTKALTVAYRTMLTQVFALPTADTEALSPQQLKLLQVLFREAGIPEREDRIAFASEVIGRVIESSKELTGAEASEVIDALRAGIDEPKTENPS